MLIQLKDNKKLYTPPPPGGPKRKFGRVESTVPPGSESRKSGPFGISIIEILIVIAIISIALVSLLGVATLSLKIYTQIKENTQAVNLAQEAIEAVRNIRDSDWTKLTNGNHGLTNAGDYWDFSGTGNLINGFTRTILIERVSRNPTTDDIETTYNPANEDSNTKKATVTVSWKDKKVELVTYFTNWKQ